jgi:hypothetical protein
VLPIGTGLAIAFATLVLFVSVTSFGIARWQTQNAARELSQLSSRSSGGWRSTTVWWSPATSDATSRRRWSSSSRRRWRSFRTRAR